MPVDVVHSFVPLEDAEDIASAYEAVDELFRFYGDDPNVYVAPGVIETVSIPNDRCPRTRARYCAVIKRAVLR